MELLVILCGMVAFVVFLFGAGAALSREWRVAVGCLAALVGFTLLAFWFNSILVANNVKPIEDRGQVTTITQRFNHTAIVYTISLSGTSSNSGLICEDGETIKCADLKLGDTITFTTWANDGWTWRVKPISASERQ